MLNVPCDRKQGAHCVRVCALEKFALCRKNGKKKAEVQQASGSQFKRAFWVDAVNRNHTTCRNCKRASWEASPPRHVPDAWNDWRSSVPTDGPKKAPGVFASLHSSSRAVREWRCAVQEPGGPETRSQASTSADLGT